MLKFMHEPYKSQKSYSYWKQKLLCTALTIWSSLTAVKEKFTHTLKQVLRSFSEWPLVCSFVHSTWIH